MKPLLTPIEEDELLAKVRLRRSLTDKRLCELYGIGRRTLWDALERAEARERGSNTTPQTTLESAQRTLLRVITTLA